MLRPVSTTALVLARAAPAAAHHRPWPAPGSLVGLTVEVEGQDVPLYAARDGSGRYYVEARRGARYALRLANRTGERLAVLMAVDGLNVISGERQSMLLPGRMYVLDPWESALVQGWRTSLDDIRRFTFVDEKRSYAARAGKANSKMGWIEMAVFRERYRPAVRDWPGVSREGRRSDSDDQRSKEQAAPAPDADASAERPPATMAPKRDGKAYGGARPESYPGTGWGEQAHDPVAVVDFQPESRPAERITMRYEYAGALRALGILPWSYGGDRLHERDRGEGFAQPPRW